MRGATNVTLQIHQILRLPRKMTAQHLAEICLKQVKCHFQCGADPTMIRAQSEHKNANHNLPRKWGYFSGFAGAFSIIKYNVSRPILHSNLDQVLHLPRKVTLDLHQVLHLQPKVTLELHQVLLHLPRKVTLELDQVLHLPRKVTLDLHQVLHLPRKVTRMVHPRDIWNLIYNARSNKCHPPNSPNTAPATQNDHPTSGRNLRKTAEILRLPRKVTLDLHQGLRLPRKVTLDLHQVLHLPRKVQLLHLPRKVTLDLHQVLHLPRKVTLDLHQVLHLPRKVTRMVHPCDIWNLIYNARSNKCHPPNSPNTAPATQNDHPTSGRNLRKTAETSFPMSFPMRGRSDHNPSTIRAQKRKPQPASQVRLRFELPRSIFYCKIQRFAPNLIFKPSPSAAPATKGDPWPSPSTAPATKSVRLLNFLRLQKSYLK